MKVTMLWLLRLIVSLELAASLHAPSYSTPIASGIVSRFSAGVQVAWLDPAGTLVDQFVSYRQPSRSNSIASLVSHAVL